MMMEPEVHVHSVRRRRSEPLTPPTPRPLNVRNGAVYLGLATIIVVLMGEGFLRHRPPDVPLPTLSHATEVRSTVSVVAESLQVVVSWYLTLSEPSGRPDSIQVRVVPDQAQRSVVAFQSPGQLADTVYLAAPERGQTLSGISCATAMHGGAGGQEVESCTPWQYVRPSVAASTSATRIVIKPSGLQIDPDVDGRCAKWQASHPGQSVWIAVNRLAVPDCTGPNEKPTVAQFCAFAVLPDGTRVKTPNSSNNSYCEELFVEWSRELYS